MTEALIEFNKQIMDCIERADVNLMPTDNIENELSRDYTREMGLVLLKLQEAQLWLDKCLTISRNKIKEA